MRYITSFENMSYEELMSLNSCHVYMTNKTYKNLIKSLGFKNFSECFDEENVVVSFKYNKMYAIYDFKIIDIYISIEEASILYNFMYYIGDGNL